MQYNETEGRVSRLGRLTHAVAYLAAAAFLIWRGVRVTPEDEPYPLLPSLLCGVVAVLLLMLAAATVTQAADDAGPS